MATFRGMDGSVTFATNVVGEVKSWSAQVTGEVLETTKMGDKWATKKGGVGSWNGQIVCHLDYGDTLGQKAMIDKLIATVPSETGTAAELLVNTGKKLTGTILITGVAVTAQLGAIIELTLTFEGSGVPVIAWA